MEIVGLHTTRLIDFEGRKAILGIVSNITQHAHAVLVDNVDEIFYILEVVFVSSHVGMFGVAHDNTELKRKLDK